jgi:hypothetical protein
MEHLWAPDLHNRDFVFCLYTRNLAVSQASILPKAKNVAAKEGYEEIFTQEINKENKERKKKSCRENYFYTFQGMR